MHDNVYALDTCTFSRSPGHFRHTKSADVQNLSRRKILWSHHASVKVPSSQGPRGSTRFVPPLWTRDAQIWWIEVCTFGLPSLLDPRTTEPYWWCHWRCHCRTRGSVGRNCFSKTLTFEKRRSKTSFPPDVWEIFPKPGPYMMKVHRLLSANNAIFCISSDVVDSFLVEGSYFYRPLACELCKVDLGEFHTANQPSERSSQDCWWTVDSWRFLCYSKSWKCKHHGRCDSKTQTGSSHYWVQIHSK